MQLRSFWFLFLCTLISSQANALEEKLQARVSAALTQAFGPQLVVSQVSKVADKQLLEVLLEDGTALHMTPDINFILFRDELYSLKQNQPKNITQARANPRRQQQLEAQKKSEMIIFPAKGKKKTHIYVFTDIDCGYCQKLHNEIDDINQLGIEVRYLSYPRAGIKNPQTGKYTDSYKKARYAWCAKDKPQAITHIKKLQQQLNRASMPLRQGQASITQKEYFNNLQQKMDGLMQQFPNCKSPIAKDFNLGQKLGVRGTPAILTEKGELYPGYLPAKQLATRLGIN